MEREFPKNVKQIGNVSDNPKIYVEDYVDTYLNQLREKAAEEPAAVVLTGEILDMDGQEVVYIAGALKLQSIQIEGGEITISEETWSAHEGEKEAFFSGQDTVGWCLIASGQPMGLTRAINRIQGKYFDRENTVFVWRDAVDSEEIYYANKFGELMPMGGHYIFYERNPSMQSYMINTRKKIGVTPSEMVEDRAAKDFRSTVREKLEYKEQKRNSGFAYALSAALVLVVLIIGVSTINNYDKMESVQSSLETLSQAVSSPEAQTKTVENDKEAENDINDDQGGDENADAAVNEDMAVNVDADGDEESNPAGAESDGMVAGNAKSVVSSGQSNSSQSNSSESDSSQSDSGEGDSGAVNTYDAVQASSANATASSGDYYIVEQGDTLDQISRKVYGSRSHVDAICRMNGLSDGNLIIVGQKLLLP